MTLIVGLITKEKGFLVCDKMHSVEGNSNSPATASLEADGMKINIQAKNIRIITGTKIYEFNNDTIYGGTGNFTKIQEFVDSMKAKNIDNLLTYVHNYYQSNRDNAPDQLMIITKKNNSYSCDVFYISNQEDSESYCYYNFKVNEEKIGVFAIGSGASIFLPIYNQIRKETIEEYNKAVGDGTYQTWENNFLERIKNIYGDVSKYDSAVSADINVEVL